MGSCAPFPHVKRRSHAHRFLYTRRSTGSTKTRRPTRTVAAPVHGRTRGSRIGGVCGTRHRSEAGPAARRVVLAADERADLVPVGDGVSLRKRARLGRTEVRLCRFGAGARGFLVTLHQEAGGEEPRASVVVLASCGRMQRGLAVRRRCCPRAGFAVGWGTFSCHESSFSHARQEPLPVHDLTQ